MSERRFRATIFGGHKEDALEVPFDPAQVWNIKTQSIRSGRRGFAVHAEINGAQFDSFVVARSGKFWLLLPGADQENAGIARGDEVSVALRPA